MRGPEATIRRAGGFGEPCRRRIDAKAWNLRLATHQDDPSSTETAMPTQGIQRTTRSGCRQGC